MEVDCHELLLFFQSLVDLSMCTDATPPQTTETASCSLQDNNWLLYLQVMSFIWFLVCSLLTAHFALWRLHVITVKCRVSLLREDSHFARFASELFRTML
jgi:hypothetical protein